ncbi:hypothetical protein NECID01_0244 [Nematocida sp. AWRm77]|nr:hypothetical protein NECID01_0244 [Nematocida sp. AWRm77]
MDISSNLRQLKFMKSFKKEEKKERETLGTWLLRELKKTQQNPHKREKIGSTKRP